MPVYEFACDDCGVFSALRRMAEASEATDCPGCGRLSRRIIVSAPGLSSVPEATRTAHETNERSANAPRTSKTYAGAHPAGCGCANHAGSRRNGAVPAVRTRAGSRPWMISH